MGRGVARVLPLAVVALLLASAGSALAEPATPAATARAGAAPSGTATAPTGSPSAPVPELVPPRLIESGEVAYPAGATGDARVTLTLVVNRDGSVRAATASDGVEPFASAAVKAAQSFRFAPATRGGVPVAATIHFEVRFTAPAPSPAAAGAAPGGTAPPPDATSPAAPRGKAEIRADSSPALAAPTEEVIVRGERQAPAVTSLGRAEVRQLPGAFGDPFRAIEALPGVTPIISGLPFFYVRGAPPGNVGYFLDGVRVPYLYHVGLGPSVVNPAMVDRVDLYPGGYPARFGRFTGGIVAGETTLPRTDFHGEGNLRVFDAGALAETGFAGGRGTVLLGGRYSYTAAVLSLIVKDVKLDYRDYQARVSYDITPKDRITAFGFGSYDLLGQEQTGGLAVLFGTEFYRLDLRYDHFYGKDDKIRFAATVGYDQTRLDQQRNTQDTLFGLRTELTHHLSSHALLRAGADATLDRYTTDQSSYVDPNDPSVLAFDAAFPPRSDYAFGTWADVVLDVAPGFEVTPGLRADLYQSRGTTAPSIDARLAAKLRVLPHLKLIHAYGLAHQPPSFVVPIPGLVPGTLSNGLQTSFQTSFGAQADLPLDIDATATVFHNAFFKMSDDLGTNVNLGPGDIDPRTLGESYGLELYAHRNLTNKLGGFLSYTLSRSTRSFRNERFLSAFDRTHVGNVALAYDLGRHWRAGTRLMFYTGIPKRPDIPRDLIQPAKTTHVDREPGFYRIDLRLEKRWLVKPSGWVSFVVEMLNATFHKETVGTTEIGPVTIPSIGLEGGF